MPSVPRLKRRVSEQAISGGRVSTNVPTPEGFEGASRAAQNLGNTVSKFALEEKRKADKQMADSAIIKLASRENELIYDEENGFKTVKGRKAAESEEAYLGRFDEAAYEIEQTLTSDSQKEAYRQALQQRRLGYSKQLQGHVFGEVQEYDNKETSANLDTLQKDLSKNYKTPGKVAESLTMAREQILAYADRNGLPPVEAERRFAEYRDKAHASVITDMVNKGDDVRAKVYLSQVREKMDNGVSADLDKMIESANLRGDGQRITDAIMAKGLSESDALKEARQIEDPKRRDEAVRRIKNRYAENKSLKEQRQYEIAESAGKQLEESKSLDSIPPSQWDQLSYSQQTALRKRERQLAAGEEPATDFGKYYKLEQLAARNKNAFKKVNLMEFRPYLSNSDYKKMSKLQASLWKDSGEDSSLFNAVESKTSIVNSALNEMGVEYGRSASKSENEKSNLFRRKVDEYVIEKQKELGREINNQELRQIIDDLRVNVITDKGFLWDTTKPLYALEAGESATVDFDDIPPGERESIRERLVSRGLEPSEEAITRIYATALSQRVSNEG